MHNRSGLSPGLYEKKFCTYPRTDSRYLTDDMEDSVKPLILCAAGIYGIDRRLRLCSIRFATVKRSATTTPLSLQWQEARQT